MHRLGAVTIFSLLAFCAQAQNPPAQPAEKTESDPLGRSTPYGTVSGFLRAATAGDYARAAQFLESRRGTEEELARQLQAVLDFGLSGNLSGVSRSLEGHLDDDLPEPRERIGSVETASGRLDIELNRVKPRSGPAIWLFSSRTLQGVPRAFDGISAPAFVRFLPESWVDIRFLSVPLWRWLSAILGLALAVFSASLVTRAVAPLLRRFLWHLTGEQDYRGGDSLTGPVRLVLLAAALKVLSNYSRSLVARQAAASIAAFLAIGGIAWLLMRFADVVSELRSRRLVRRQKQGKLAVMALERRLFKIVIVTIAIVMILHRAGFNVTAIVAGLGLGGVALALAAQKTLENVFGGISVIAREAIRVGDVCEVAGQRGVVEDIGLGSTRLRTASRTVVSVPNAQLAQLSMENISMRDKFWIHQVVGLSQDTSAAQLRTILAEIGSLLRNDARIEPSTARVRFVGFGTSSLTLEIVAYVLKQDDAEFLQAQQELLLGILETIDAAGASVASSVLVRNADSHPKLGFREAKALGEEGDGTGATVRN
jgi:MscS family membrane protein